MVTISAQAHRPRSVPVVQRLRGGPNRGQVLSTVILLVGACTDTPPSPEPQPLPEAGPGDAMADATLPESGDGARDATLPNSADAQEPEQDPEVCEGNGAESCEGEPSWCPVWAQTTSEGSCPPGAACWMHGQELWCATNVVSEESCETQGTVLPGAEGRAELHRLGCGATGAVAEVRREDGVALCCSDGCFRSPALYPLELLCREDCSRDLNARDARHVCGDDPNNLPGQANDVGYVRTAGCGLVVWERDFFDVYIAEVFDEESGELVGVEFSGWAALPQGLLSCSEHVRGGVAVPPSCPTAVVQYCGLR